MKGVRHRSGEVKTALIILGCAAVVALILSLVLLYANRSPLIRFIGGNTLFYIDDNVYELSAEPIKAFDAAYIPAADVFTQCGYSVEYNEEKNAVSISNRDGKSYIYIDSKVVTKRGENKTFAHHSFIYNGSLYIPTEMFSELCDYRIQIDGELTEVTISE